MAYVVTAVLSDNFGASTGNLVGVYMDRDAAEKAATFTRSQETDNTNISVRITEIKIGETRSLIDEQGEWIRGENELFFAIEENC